MAAGTPCRDVPPLTATATTNGNGGLTATTLLVIY
jgi:hypothetical protein